MPEGDGVGAPDPVALTRRLVRFDTTNPPGDEAACAGFVAGLAVDAGLDVRTLAGDPDRPTVLVRLAGRGAAPPLLLHAHTDVVPVDGQRWTRPPFAAEEADGELWGRGSVDMKGGLAMMLTALLRLRAEGTAPAGDVLLAVVPDEEAGSAAGAGFLVREHRELFAGVRYAVGEDGGAGLELGWRRRLHPVVVAEKRALWLRVVLRGPGGHASRAAGPDSPVRQLGRLLAGVRSGGLGVRPVPVVTGMLAELAGGMPEPEAGRLALLADDPTDPAGWAGLSEHDERYLRSVLQHTVNPTVLRAGTVTNVLPDEVTVELDCRLLPGGFGVEDLLAALAERVGRPLEAEVLVEGEPMGEPLLDGFYQLLRDVLAGADPAGLPVPMMTTASTDARLFAQLGIACYGWLPMLLPAGTNHRALLHCPDERVPVDALRFGADCFTTLLRRYGSAG